MLNGLEKSLEKHLPESERRCPLNSEHRTPEHSHSLRHPDTGQRGIKVTQISNMFG